ncbi:MAG: hypothetical protein QM760_02030 [Nibricoccus sp.]
MVSAPVMVLLYDRTFVAGSFSKAWQLRKRVYLGLAASWIILALLVLHAGTRGGTAGFGGGVSSWSYLLTQCKALLLYVRLSIWPDSLVFDHGTELVGSFAEVIPQGLAVLGALVAAGFALKFRPRADFWLRGFL